MPLPRKLRSPLGLAAVTLTVFFCIFVIVFSLLSLQSKKAQTQQTTPEQTLLIESDRFPVSVNPKQKKIVENNLIDWYVDTHLSIDTSKYRQNRLASKLLAKITRSSVYLQFASPLTRVLVIYPGERKEEVAKNFSDILRWTKTERETFSALVTEETPVMIDGKFFPGKYTVSTGSEPEEVANLLTEKFSKEILARYDDKVAAQVPLNDALTIASLLEREAYDFTDMRIISGIIWNRLFINMPLQLDATLQYAKGSQSTEAKWWPQVKPADKYIKSDYNTYKNVGLPPTPIANPSVEAVVAALNPRETDCLFYFHDDDGGFYCSVTYEEHVIKLKEVFGQGS